MPDTATTTGPPAFRDLLADQIAAARDAALANELTGQHELADWWRWRAEDLGRYLSDGRDTAGDTRSIGGSMGHDTETRAA